MLTVGDSAKVELIFLGQGSAGRVVKGATVITNDTVTTKPALQMIMDVVANFDSTFPVTISTAKYDFFAAGKEKEGFKFKAVIKNISEDELKAEVVNYPKDMFKVKLSSKKVKPNRTAKLEVELNKNFKEKDFSKGVTLEFASAKESSRFTIPLLNPVKTPKADSAKATKAIAPGGK